MPRVPALVVLSVLTLLTAVTRSPAPLAATAPRADAAPATARLAVRSGDPAPVTPRVPAGIRRPGFTSDGGVIFRDQSGTAIYKHMPGATTILAYVGERYPGGAIDEIYDAVPAPNGSILAVAGTAARGSVLLRIPAAGGTPEPLLASGQVLAVPGGSAVVEFLFAPSVDGSGRVVLLVWLDNPSGPALVRLSASGDPEVLVRTGDALGGAAVRGLLFTAPGVSGSGDIAFVAELTSDVQVLATITGDGAPVVAASFPIDPAYPSGPLAYAGPSINDAG